MQHHSSMSGPSSSLEATRLLRQALRRADATEVRTLLARGAAVQGYYLDQAAVLGHAEVVQALLVHDDDDDDDDSNNGDGNKLFTTADCQSALVNAVVTGQAAVVLVLLQRHPHHYHHQQQRQQRQQQQRLSPNFTTAEGDTPLHLCLQTWQSTNNNNNNNNNQSSLRILQTLLQHGANPNAVDPHGRTPLSLLDENDAQAVQVLLHYGATVDAAALLGKAIRAGHTDVVRTLCTMGGANPNARLLGQGGRRLHHQHHHDNAAITNATTTTTTITSSTTALELALQLQKADLIELFLTQAYANPTPVGAPPLLAILDEEPPNHVHDNNNNNNNTESSLWNLHMADLQAWGLNLCQGNANGDTLFHVAIPKWAWYQQQQQEQEQSQQDRDNDDDDDDDDNQPTSTTTTQPLLDVYFMQLLTDLISTVPAIVCQTNAVGDTPLHVLARSTDLNPTTTQWLVQQVFLAKNKAVHEEHSIRLLQATNSHGYSPLHVAVLYNHVAAVKAMIAYGSGENNDADYEYGDGDASFLLFECLNQPDTANGWTALHWAVALQRETIVGLLVRAMPSSVNVRTRCSGLSPLHLVGFPSSSSSSSRHHDYDISDGNDASVDDVISSNQLCDWQHLSDRDVTRILQAPHYNPSPPSLVSEANASITKKQQCSILSSLLTHGANPLATDKAGNFPWFLAARSSDNHVTASWIMLRAAAAQGLFDGLLLNCPLSPLEEESLCTTTRKRTSDVFTKTGNNPSSEKRIKA